MLNIKRENIGGHLTMTLSGRLDRMTAPDLEAKINSSLGGVNKITFDFKDLEYISSAGLRVILAAQKKLKKDDAVEIKGASPEIKDVFEVTGFNRILKIVWM